MDNLTDLFSGIFTVLLFTSFVKILTTLSIFQFGLGLRSSAFSLVMILVSFVLSIFIFSQELTIEGHYNKLFSSEFQLDAQREDAIKTKMLSIADPQLIKKLKSLKHREMEEAQKAGENFSAVVVAFLVTELRAAFQLGFLFIIPFLVIDLIVANVLMSLNINQLSVYLVSIPIKIFLFISVDGWQLIVTKLLNSYF